MSGLSEGMVTKGGIGTKPITPRPSDPKGQGGHDKTVEKELACKEHDICMLRDQLSRVQHALMLSQQDVANKVKELNRVRNSAAAVEKAARGAIRSWHEKSNYFSSDLGILESALDASEGKEDAAWRNGCSGP